MLSDIDDPDTLEAEAAEVRKLEKALDQSLGTLGIQLAERAEQLEERRREFGSSDHESQRYSAPIVKEFDIDQLFAGLAER